MKMIFDYCKFRNPQSLAIVNLLLTRIHMLERDTQYEILSKVNKWGYNALILAARAGVPDITEEILNMIPEDKQRKMIRTYHFPDFRSAFEEAVNSGDLKTLNVLLDWGPTLLEQEDEAYEADRKAEEKRTRAYKINATVTIRPAKVSGRTLVGRLQEALKTAKDLSFKNMLPALEEAIQKAKDWCKENNKEW